MINAATECSECSAWAAQFFSAAWPRSLLLLFLSVSFQEKSFHAFLFLYNHLVFCYLTCWEFPASFSVVRCCLLLSMQGNTDQTSGLTPFLFLFSFWWINRLTVQSNVNSIICLYVLLIYFCYKTCRKLIFRTGWLN